MSRLADYARHTTASYPGAHAASLDGLGDTPAAIAAAVQKLLLHPRTARQRQIPIPEGSLTDRESRTIRRMLARVRDRDARPLSEPRAPPARFFGTGRDHALLAASLFRQRGVPARLRVGFAAYLVPGFLEDHWVCEYWHESAWRLLDAQLDAAARAELSVDFDPLDVPAGRFLRAGAAWQRLAAGDVAGERIGVSFQDIAGSWFAAGSVCRDIAVLSGREELLPWDYWGQAAAFCAAGAVPEPWPRHLAEVAALVAGADVDLDRLLPAYAGRDWLYLEGSVTSYGNGAPETVDLRSLA